MEKEKGNASVNTTVVMLTEWDTVTAAETTVGGIEYLVEHVACAVDSIDGTSCSGKWDVNSGATGHFADRALLRFLSARMSNYDSLNTERTYVTE